MGPIKHYTVFKQLGLLRYLKRRPSWDHYRIGCTTVAFVSSAVIAYTSEFLIIINPCMPVVVEAWVGDRWYLRLRVSNYSCVHVGMTV